MGIREHLSWVRHPEHQVSSCELPCRLGPSDGGKPPQSQRGLTQEAEATAGS